MLAAAEVPGLRFAFEKAEMGLPFRITLFAADEAAAKEAADAAFARIAELNAVFSDYDPDSELSRLSRSAGSGSAVLVSAELWDLLVQAQELSENTGGAFDVTVGPLVNLWRRARRKGELPPAEEIATMKTRVGWRELQLDRERRTVMLVQPEMRLDCASMAKGRAVDAALAALRARGVTRALVGGGGDFAAGDPPPGQPGWRVEVATSEAPGAPPAQTVLLANHALGTSGDLFQHVEIEGVRYSHIVDPQTGRGLTDRSLVHVLGKDCRTASSHATAVSVLGPERGVELIEATADLAVRIVRSKGAPAEWFVSSRWPK
jgi:thiamine biosynthesis lipoprotein